MLTPVKLSQHARVSMKNENLFLKLTGVYSKVTQLNNCSEHCSF